MVARIFIITALVILAASFAWFTGMVMWLGLKSFFKLKCGNTHIDETSKSASPSEFCPSKPEL